MLESERNQRSSEYLPSILNGLSGLGVLAVSLLLELRFSVPAALTKLFGILLVIIGMMVVVWSAMYLKKAFYGTVRPILDVLIVKGPYRFVRHPVYLGMIPPLAGRCLE
ncbi:MAG: methyltransferase family protein [Bacteroidota bacterium]